MSTEFLKVTEEKANLGAGKEATYSQDPGDSVYLKISVVER